MNELVLRVMLQDGGFSLAVEPVNERSVRHFADLMSVFDGEMSEGTYHVFSEQCANSAMKERVTSFVDSCSRQYPRLNKLKKRICDLPDDQYFLVLPQEPTSSAEKAALEVYLGAVNDAKGDFSRATTLFEERYKAMQEVAGKFMDTYDIFQPRSDIRVSIGAKNKKDRSCRFCGRSEGDGATFKKVAHAIPEALGNKNVVLTEECDECNEFFGNEIEPTFISYFDVYRVFIGARGKNKIPHIKYKNGDLLHDGKMAVVASRSIFGDPEQGLEVKLESSVSITPINFYKSLVKVALSVIDSQHLQYLKDAVSWVRFDHKHGVNVPKIAVNVVNEGFCSSPQVTVYTRKTEDLSVPHVVSEFRFGSYVYVYIVPFSKKDDRRFVNGEGFEEFWDFFGHYHVVEGWSFQSFNSWKSTPFNYNVKLSKSE